MVTWLPRFWAWGVEKHNGRKDMEEQAAQVMVTGSKEGSGEGVRDKMYP